jgi:hypothetical protein
MQWFGWAFASIAVVTALGTGWLARRLLRAVRESRVTSALKQFRYHREYLEAKFLDLAARTGKPRGLAWESCEFDDHVEFARDRQTGQLRALVGVAIRFSAIEGGGMEDVEAVNDTRAATALFQHQNGRWTTQGRALFNVNPREAIDHYPDDLDLVTGESAGDMT